MKKFSIFTPPHSKLFKASLSHKRQKANLKMEVSMIEDKMHEPTTEVVKVRKKPGPKPKNKTQEEVANSDKNVLVFSEPFDYDYVIKVLDEAKRKIERQKEKEGKKEGFGYRNNNIVAFIVPTLFLIVLGIQFILLFTT